MSADEVVDGVRSSLQDCPALPWPVGATGVSHDVLGRVQVLRHVGPVPIAGCSVAVTPVSV